MRKYSTKVVGWFKTPVFITEDYRVERLIANEGMKGFGLYISMLCHIYYKKSECLTQQQIYSIKENGCSIRTVKRVIEDYGLFCIDAYGHVTSAINYLPEGCPTITTLSPLAAPDDVSDNAPDDVSDNAPDDAPDDAPDAFPTPARVPIKYNDYDNDNDKKNDYHHSKKDDDDDDDTIKPLIEFVDDDAPIPHVASDPISIIRQLPLQSQWTEMALMKCSPTLRQLVIDNWEQAKELFAQHVIANCKEKSILTEEDAKRYFLYYLNNPYTSAHLQKHLVETLRQQQLERLIQEQQNYELSE